MPTNPNTAIEEKMDQILLHLKKIDDRDRLRMIGGTVRFFISLIPIIILVWSVWYTIVNGPELMKALSEQAASAAAKYTQQQGGSLYDQVMEKVKR
ncbi:MAG: hypothetical protein ABL890_04455 [Candidatus Peribacteraceae bacterium]